MVVVHFLFYLLKNVDMDEIITTDRYRAAFPNLYFKTDAFYWRQHPRNHFPLLITGHSDYGITDSLVDFYNPGVWFTVNKENERANVVSLPLGITNNTLESPLHPVYGNLDCMAQVMAETVAPTNLVYLNFNVRTFPSERIPVWTLFSQKPWVTVGSIENTIAGRTQFLRDIKAHAFVLCPRGNGVDTHRLWETLYMGSIPILRRHAAYREFEDMPICFVDEWEEVTEDFLKNEERRIRHGRFSLEKLKLSYWVNRIQKEIAANEICASPFSCTEG